jgi:hypothetical protein
VKLQQYFEQPGVYFRVPFAAVETELVIDRVILNTLLIVVLEVLHQKLGLPQLYITVAGEVLGSLTLRTDFLLVLLAVVNENVEEKEAASK